jgi:uncharacterized repeat protein (TIGR03803 family)
MTRPSSSPAWIQSGLALAILASSTFGVAQAGAPVAPLVTELVITNFGTTTGESPFMENLVQGKDGDLYGTTIYGGTGSSGTIFKVDTAGTLTTLYNFTGASDGSNPESGLTLGIDGNFYGTTYQGGMFGDGTAFKMTPAGVLTTLHSFDDTDGGFPNCALVQGTDKNFYGTTSYSTPTIYGTVFKMTPSGVLTTLHFFTDTDGYQPLAGLVQGTDGNFYGTTATGGTSGFGTFFKITPTGTLTSLYSFDNTHGWEPEGQLIQGTDGNFYGTTLRGGASGDGEVFKITPTGTITVIHSFDITDGYEPSDSLVQATNGLLYGTTSGGGANSFGNVFEMPTTGTETDLYDFQGAAFNDGATPFGGLVQHTSGGFFGITNSGGTGRLGTVFLIDAGLGPFVRLLPTSGKVGSTVTILGTNLTGITKVTFGTKSAMFKPGSKTSFTATVPTGATTGFVTVTYSGGSLKSNVKFRVP